MMDGREAMIWLVNPTPFPMPQPLHILWQDDHLVAVYKPAGWLVHRTGLDAGETRFVMQTLRDQLGRHVFPVHRLDKGTCGVLVMALDAAKAAVPLWLAEIYFAADPRRDWILVGMAAAAFIGHLFPIFSGFRGGKGVATALGAFVALAPKAAGLGFLTYAVVYAIFRISSVGSLCAVLSFPAWLYLVGARRPTYVLAAGLLVGILFTHRGNLARLFKGQEKKL